MSNHPRDQSGTDSGASSTLPPRVLVVMPEQWPRAMTRAALREVGYDAIGARSLREALLQPVRPPARGAVRAIVIEQNAARDTGPLDALRSMHSGAAMILLAHPTREPSAGAWDLVLSRPFSIADVVSAIERLVPLEKGRRSPVDAE